MMPISAVATNLAHLGLNFAMFLGFWLYYRFRAGVALPPAWHMLGFLPVLVVAAILGVAMGLLLASTTIRYRDVKFFLPFLSQLWMYASPVIYPSSSVGQRWHWIVAANPMAWVVEATRRCLTGQGTFAAAQAVAGVAAALVLLAIGLLVFNRAQRTFVDVA